MASILVHPDYKNCGLPPEARRMARKNPNTRRTVLEASSEVTRFLSELGVIDARQAPRWRALGLMA